MSFAKALLCRQCGHEYPVEPRSRCELCLSPVEVTYDYEAMAAVMNRDKPATGPTSMWRYKDMLPVDGEVIDIGTGFTPLVKADTLGKEIGLDRLYIKNDCLTPTYSFKDRPVSVAATKAREFGFDTLACASTGNLAASVAAHAAKAGLKAYVFVPASVEPGKLIGIAIYNPNLVTVEGSYDDVNRLCARLVERYQWGFININLRPYYAEGSKTLGYEVAEQLGWRTPDCVIAPGGSGLMFTRIKKGFDELKTLGMVDSVGTRMFIAQASGSSPIVNAFESGSEHVNPVTPDTIAKSIAIGNPADGPLAISVARESGGGAIAVSDEELIVGVRLLAETEGIFAEATGGVVIASLKKLAESGVIKRDDLTVAYITGAGPRTQDSVADIVKPYTVQPSIESFEEVLGAHV